MPRAAILLGGLLVCSVLVGCMSAVVYAAEGSEPVEVTLDQARKKARVEIAERHYSFHLVQITDSRCPANAKCIWVGELAARIRIERVDQPAGPLELTLGQLTVPSTELLNAQLVLVSIDETSVTFTVKAADEG